MNKPRIAIYWCASCGGCEESLIDLGEDLLKLARSAEIIFWPAAMDGRFSDLEALADGSIFISLINGAIQQEDHVNMARLLRKKSRFVIANGSCAQIGGVIGLANLHRPKEVLQRAYIDAETVANPPRTIPGSQTASSCPLPRHLNRVRTLDQVIDVDYYIPGCPPPSELVKNAIFSLLENNFPLKGSILSENRALCHTCPRQGTLPEHLSVLRFKRIHETLWNPRQCFLDQGIICLGPSTRGGCRSRCISANMPCRGCLGPLDGVRDQGAKTISFIASLIEETDPEKIAAIVSQIADPTGLFYRYSLAASLIKTRHKGLGQTDGFSRETS
ncbi:MAG: oxidoreductase [Deltaproteobacteria bacterium]|nr:oxidoreductase [Deltaproteobacteria bacterium]